MLTIFTIKNLHHIKITARQFVNLMKDRSEKIYCFIGEMGSGKTTFIKAICEDLGVIDNINSPTFSIVNEYTTKNDETIFHFDLYRLENLEAALNIGIEEYLQSGNYCFIEWPEIIEDILPDNFVVVEIEETEDGVRMITVN